MRVLQTLALPLGYRTSRTKSPTLDHSNLMTPSQPNGEEEAVFEWPITDVLDLHTVPPREVTAVVEAWLDAVWEAGFTALRIVHGKGIGVQREAVRKVLGRTPFVVAFGDAPLEAGGWGATVVTLASRPPDSPDPARR